MKKKFREIQKFNQWWLWLIISAALIVTLVAWWKLSNDVEFIQDDRWGLLFTFFIEVLVIVLFRIMYLKTDIDSRRISVQFYPFAKKEILWSEVQSAVVLNYGFVGWGIRFFTRYGTVYNIKGSKGLHLELNSKKKFLIGTQREDELRRFLNDNIHVRQKES